MKEYKDVLVAGLGVSGFSASKLLLRDGVAVTVVDCNRSECTDSRAELLINEGAVVNTGCERLPDKEFDLCVLSPGISFDSEWISELKIRGIDIVSELEFGAECCGVPVVAVTGSNGKSTMVKLCSDAMTLSGVNNIAGANYGIPLSDIAMSSVMPEWIIAEVSSFQLEAVVNFRPRVAVLMNIQPDHLDRHKDMGEYRDLKLKLFSNMSVSSGDVCIIHEGVLPQIAESSYNSADFVTFGSNNADYIYADGKIRSPNGQIINVSGSPFESNIMGETAAAAAAVLDGCGLDSGVLEEVCRSFVALPHRMQFITEKRGVNFWDDSKATNLSAMNAALNMTSGYVRLIAGGLLKEENLEILKESLERTVKKAYLIGKSSDVMYDAWHGYVDCVKCNVLEGAVESAWSDSVSGDNVLLSPGCASFDQFKSYSDRGDKFRLFVDKLG